MRYDPDRHHRRSIRLDGYDYHRAGAYFITVVAQDRTCAFGGVVDRAMRLNAAGEMVQTVWDELPIHYTGVEIDALVVMPNHIHGIVVLTAHVPAPADGVDRRVDVGAALRGRPAPNAGPQEEGQPRGVAPTLSLPDVVHRLKTMTTKRYVDGVKQAGWAPFRGRLWQRNYFEHIIRNDESLHRLRQYIADNPAAWQEDAENPAATEKRPP